MGEGLFRNPVLRSAVGEAQRGSRAEFGPRPVLSCLGKTKDGHPRHPLYVRSDEPLVPWRAP